MRCFLTQRVLTKVVLTLSVIFISACATTNSANTKLNANWVGRNFDEFVMRYGAPHSSYRLSNGDVSYSWSSGSRNAPIVLRGQITYGVHYSSGDTQRCDLQLMTSNGIIKRINVTSDSKGTWTGSYCYDTLN